MTTKPWLQHTTVLLYNGNIMERLYDLIRSSGIAPNSNLSEEIRTAAVNDFNAGLPFFVADNAVTYGLVEQPMLSGLLDNAGPLRLFSALPLFPEMFVEAKVPGQYAPLLGSDLIGVHVLTHDLWANLTPEEAVFIDTDESARYLLEYVSHALTATPLTWEDQATLHPIVPIRYRMELIFFRSSPIVPPTPHMSPYRVAYFLDPLGRLAFGQENRPLIFSSLLDEKTDPRVMLDPVRARQQFRDTEMLSETAHYFLPALMIQALPDTAVIRIVPNTATAEQFSKMTGKEIGRPYYVLARPSEKTIMEINQGVPPTSRDVLSIPLDIFSIPV